VTCLFHAVWLCLRWMRMQRGSLHPPASRCESRHC
jgi:hypothetical protein